MAEYGESAKGACCVMQPLLKLLCTVSGTTSCITSLFWLLWAAATALHHFKKASKLPNDHDCQHTAAGD
jgi:hypothetical protein